jgi:hypothetical protein
MREAYDRTGDTDSAVIEGVGRTGRLVTSAALIMGLAFVAFSATPGTEAKMFATALGGGILIDATIIRGVLAPAPSRSSAAGTGGCPPELRGYCASSPQRTPRKTRLGRPHWRPPLSAPRRADVPIRLKQRLARGSGGCDA